MKTKKELFIRLATPNILVMDILRILIIGFTGHRSPDRYNNSILSEIKLCQQHITQWLLIVIINSSVYINSFTE